MTKEAAENCYHCGLDVPNGATYSVVIRQKEQPMCCAGCEAVAKAIVDGGLESFYDHRETKSPKPEDLVPEELQRLALYDQEALQDSFVEIEEAIEQILNQQINADEFVLLVHRFRGGCAYSGCKRLESLTTTIEDSLRQHGDVAQVEPELLELSDEIEKVKQAAKQLNQQLS